MKVTITYHLTRQGQAEAIRQGVPAHTPQTVTGDRPKSELDILTPWITDAGEVTLTIPPRSGQYGSLNLPRAYDSPQTVDSILDGLRARLQADQQKHRQTVDSILDGEVTNADASNPAHVWIFGPECYVAVEKGGYRYDEALVRAEIFHARQKADKQAKDMAERTRLDEAVQAAIDANTLPMSVKRDGLSLGDVWVPQHHPGFTILRDRHDQAIAAEAEQLAAERSAVIDTAGTDSERERWQEGLLPDRELEAIIARALHDRLVDAPLYRKIRAQEMGICCDSDYDDHDHDLKCSSAEADAVPPREWEAVKRLRALLEGRKDGPPRVASLVIRRHYCYCTHDGCSGAITRYGLSVEIRRGRLSARREYSLDPS